MFEEILAPLFTTVPGRRAGLGAAVLMSILLCLSVIGGFYSWWQDATLSHHANRSSFYSTASADELSKLIAAIPSWHLFGKYGVVEQSAELPITSLHLRLVGVMQAAPEKLSRAIISEGGQPGKVFQAGDHLSSGVTVYAIGADGVILENGGRLEKLPLQRPALEFQGMPKSLLDSQGE